MAIARVRDWVQWRGTKHQVVAVRRGVFMPHYDLLSQHGSVIPFVPSVECKKIAAEPRSVWNWVWYFLRGMRE